ncbi:MAG: 6-phosphogluconate dehydrogenase [Ilumatobacter sp.]|nr:MAG: 6-phosphogluconate dehydrogenase [Ilumatobacter sp.]
MTDVSVIGTGVMGSALAEALATAGAQVTVWNRTRQKAEALSGPRVRVAESVAEALTLSPLTIVSVSNHDLARALVEEADEDLTGKTVASTSFATPEQARALAAVLSSAGAWYLDVSIPAYPSEVRARAGVFLISGERRAWEAHRHWFEQIGQATYVDDTPGAAHISEMAVVLAYLPMAVGLLQGMRICQDNDISLKWFREFTLQLYPRHIRSLLDRVIATPDPAERDVEASIDTWAIGAAEYITYLREQGLDPGLYEALHHLFRAASEAGQGDADWTSITEHGATR